jgi:hypothetical protein
VNQELLRWVSVGALPPPLPCRLPPTSSRIDMPPRWSRWIAAYCSTFDIRGVTNLSEQHT